LFAASSKGGLKSLFFGFVCGEQQGRPQKPFLFILLFIFHFSFLFAGNSKGSLRSLFGFVRDNYFDFVRDMSRTCQAHKANVTDKQGKFSGLVINKTYLL
jgi:hypothetical protein